MMRQQATATQWQPWRPPLHDGDKFERNGRSGRNGYGGDRDHDHDHVHRHGYHPHEHGSDDEEDDLPRQRSRSFSDAEDILNGMVNHDTSLVEATTAPTGGLHHRSRHVIARNNSSDEYYSSAHEESHGNAPATNGTYHRNSFRTAALYATSAVHGSASTRKKSIRKSKLVKGCFLLGVGSYLILIIRSSVWLAVQNPVDDSPNFGSSFGPSIFYTSHTDAQRQAWSQQRVILRRETRVELEQRASQRRQRTTPRSMTADDDVIDLSWYNVQRVDERIDYFGSPRRSLSESGRSRANFEHLCGYHAQNASLTHPDAYPSSAALNEKARVLITGILNPLGFSLALHLKEKCGVQVIAGIDNMYPNTVLNRLQLQDRTQILTTNIPKMSKPIILPFIALDTKEKKESGSSSKSNQEYNLMDLKPTHIVHLASFSQDVFSTAMVDEMWRNTHSPYVSEEDAFYEPHLYQLRTSLVGMEQILSSINMSNGERPQLLYASSSQGASGNPLQAGTKLIDEVLADTYYSTYGISSVAVRLPNSIYGPWGQPGSAVHDMIESAVGRWDATRTQNLAPEYVYPDDKLDMVYVDDAVQAIVAAMQRQSSQPETVEITSGLEASVGSVSSMIQSFSPNRQITVEELSNFGKAPLLPIQNTKNGESSTSNQRRSLFKWIGKTTLYDGMIKTLAWHLDRHSPFGPAVETGDQFLKRNGKSTCAPSDLSCHRNKQYLPCLSECNTHDQCLPSVFDEVMDLSVSVSEGCDIVLYSQSIGYDVEDLDLVAEFMDDTDLDDNESLLCNFVFVPRDSELVKIVTEKVPNEQLAKFGIKPEDDSSGKSLHERMLDGLNGRLLYRGWILIWVPDAIKPISVEDASLLKLSPSKFFHPTVSTAIFVEENFAVSPNIDDVLFLVGEMKRKKFKKRTLKKEKTIELPNGGEHVKKVKYRLPEEPQRRAAILFAPLRVPNIDDPVFRKYRYNDKFTKLTVHDAAKFMRYENGLDPLDKEPVEIRRQREFYERITSYINRNTELRSGFEPWYRYSLRHWVRTRWVVHDLKLEDSRLLRCDWYQEHVQWGAGLDQLSFAHVMAARELKRRIAHNEPDDHIKTFIELNPDLHDLTDSYEWHPMETERNRLYREPTGWNVEVPDHVVVEDEDDTEEEDQLDHSQVPLYVRIMSERVMAASRKVWSKHRKAEKKEKEKTKQKHKKHKHK